MGARNSKSRKASGASSGSTPPRESIVFFLDKCLGRFVVANALRKCGERVEIHENHFEADTPDHEWVPEVGRRGWIILSKDTRLRHNNIELIALLKANTHSFILTSASQSGPEMAAAFVAALRDIKKILVRFQAPCVATVSPAGRVSVYLTHAGLIEQICTKHESEQNIAALNQDTTLLKDVNPPA
jgi:hypothetical protein